MKGEKRLEINLCLDVKDRQTHLIATIDVPRSKKAYALSLNGSLTIRHGGKILGGSRPRAMKMVGKVRQKFMLAMIRRVSRNAEASASILVDLSKDMNLHSTASSLDSMIG